MTTAEDLGFIIERASRFKLNPFDEEFYSLNLAGNYQLFIHYLIERDCLVFYSPLITLSSEDQTTAVLKAVLQNNLPSQGSNIKCGLDSQGMLWQSLTLAYNEALTADLNELIEDFLTKADLLLNTLSALPREDDGQAARQPLTGDAADVPASESNKILWG